MIAIKDMEMPKCCAKCDFKEDYCFYCIKLQNKIPQSNFFDSRLLDCPLIEIVTCKDCKHCKKDVTEGEKLLWCKKDGFATSEDYYCGSGKRE